MQKTLALTTIRNKGQNRKTNLHMKYRLGHILLDYASSKTLSRSML